MELLEIERRLNQPKKFKADVLRAIKDNNAKVDITKSIAGIAFYHEQNILVGSSSETFFTGNFLSGNTNISNSFQRPEAEHVFISGIRILEGDNPANLNNSIWGDITTPELLNGEFTITVNGVVMLKNYPVTEALQGQTGKFQNMISLKELIFWEGQTEMKLDLKLKQAAVVVNIPVRFELIGVGLVS